MIDRNVFRRLFGMSTLVQIELAIASRRTIWVLNSFVNPTINRNQLYDCSVILLVLTNNLELFLSKALFYMSDAVKLMLDLEDWKFIFLKSDILT